MLQNGFFYNLVFPCLDNNASSFGRRNIHTPGTVPLSRQIPLPTLGRIVRCQCRRYQVDSTSWVLRVYLTSTCTYPRLCVPNRTTHLGHRQWYRPKAFVGGTFWWGPREIDLFQVCNCFVVERCRRALSTIFEMCLGTFGIVHHKNLARIRCKFWTDLLCHRLCLFHFDNRNNLRQTSERIRPTSRTTKMGARRRCYTCMTRRHPALTNTYRGQNKLLNRVHRGMSCIGHPNVQTRKSRTDHLRPHVHTDKHPPTT